MVENKRLNYIVHVHFLTKSGGKLYSRKGWDGIVKSSFRSVYRFLSGDQSYRAGIFKKSMGPRNRGGIGLSYRPARLHRLAEFIPWNQFRGSINI